MFTQPLSQENKTGKTILLTRTEVQSQSLQQRLEELGYTVLNQPVLEILPVDDPSEIDSLLIKLESFDWLIFSSSNGVHFFLRHFMEREREQGRNGEERLKVLRQQGKRIAAMGPGTARAITEHGLKVDRIPSRFCAEGMVEVLSEEAVNHRHFLSLRASRGRQILAEQLTKLGGKVTELVVYQSRDVVFPDESIREKLDSGQIDSITVTSSASARSLISLFGDSLKRARLIAISPLTGSVLHEAGFPVMIAEEASDNGLLRCVQR